MFNLKAISKYIIDNTSIKNVDLEKGELYNKDNKAEYENKYNGYYSEFEYSNKNITIITDNNYNSSNDRLIDIV